MLLKVLDVQFLFLYGRFLIVLQSAIVNLDAIFNKENIAVFMDIFFCEVAMFWS
jgi:hypothetical protein